MMYMNQIQISNKSEIMDQQAKVILQIQELENQSSGFQREIEAIQLVENGYVEIISDVLAIVKSSADNKGYEVTGLDAKECECKDHEFRSKYGIVCKHRLAVGMARTEQKRFDAIAVEDTQALIQKDLLLDMDESMSDKQKAIKLVFAMMKKNPKLKAKQAMILLIENDIDISIAEKTIKKIRFCDQK